MMECFEGCFVNRFGELIISDRGNVYFTAKGCKDKTDIICKLLEWCSRPIAKGTPYASAKRNQEWREKLLEGYNKYLGTQFTQTDMYWIYDKLGNAANHELTLKFIESGYNLSLVYPQHPKGHFRATDSRESAGIVGLSVNEAKGIKSW